MKKRRMPAKTPVRLSPRVEFKEGDAVVRISSVGSIHASDTDRGLLLVSTDGWLAICFTNRKEDCLDLSGIRWAGLSYYRLATPEERLDILLSKIGKEFGKHRGPDYFAKWEAKLKTVIGTAIAAEVFEKVEEAV